MRPCVVAGSEQCLVVPFMMRLALSVLALLIPVQLFGSDVSVPVVRVIDGDTIEVLHNSKPERIRLHGIDCPEKRQAFGQRAKQATSDLVFGKHVTIRRRGKDRNGRTVADVLLADQMNVNQTLVLNGWCGWNQKYAPKDLALQQAEEEARRERLILLPEAPFVHVFDREFLTERWW